jgi:hypothetical protein
MRRVPVVVLSIATFVTMASVLAADQPEGRRDSPDPRDAGHEGRTVYRV